MKDEGSSFRKISDEIKSELSKFLQRVKPENTRHCLLIGLF